MAIPFASSIDLLKNEIINAVFQNLATAPSNPIEGQFYYNTTDKKMMYYNGTTWIDSSYLLPIATSAVLGGIKVGSGLSITADGTLNATGTSTPVIDNLTSTSTSSALSANQGRILKGLIDTIQSAIDGLGTAASKNTGTAAGNIPILGTDGKLNTSVLPALALTEVNTVSSQSAMLALTAQTGDVAIRTDVNKTFILAASPASTLANWKELLFPVSVTSVNGKTGVVTLDASDIAYSTTYFDASNVKQALDAFIEEVIYVLNQIGTLCPRRYVYYINVVESGDSFGFNIPDIHDINIDSVSVFIINPETEGSSDFFDSIPVQAEIYTSNARKRVQVVFGNLGDFELYKARVEVLYSMYIAPSEV